MDGNTTDVSSNDDSDDNVNESDDDQSIYDTDDEVDSVPIPAVFVPLSGQTYSQGVPQRFDVNLTEDTQSSSLPLCLVMNCRSACNKVNNLRELLNTIGPSVTILSETWERDKQRMDAILNSRQFNSVSYYRKNQSPGGGCAIIYDKNQFLATDPEIAVPENVEAIWSILTPASECQNRHNVKILRSWS